MRNPKRVLEGFIILLASFPLLAMASEQNLFVIGSDSEMHLQGRATLRKWRFESHEVTGFVKLEATPEDLKLMIQSVETALRSGVEVILQDLGLQMCNSPRALVTVPVGSLANRSSAMTRDMYKALKKEQFPVIKYTFSRLIDVRVIPGADTSITRLSLTTEGVLEIAGVRKFIEMDVLVEHDKNRFKVFGEKRVKMTDFGIDPPSQFFGLIRVRDEVDVIFDLVVGTDS